MHMAQIIFIGEKCKTVIWLKPATQCLGWTIISNHSLEHFSLHSQRTKCLYFLRLSKYEIINFNNLFQLSPFIRLEEELLKVEHLRSIPLVYPGVLVLLSSRDIPSPVLRIILVQILSQKPGKQYYLETWSTTGFIKMENNNIFKPEVQSYL